jgi:hypothetical protein
MAEDYAYTIAQCDVAPERRAELESYRDKRRIWLSWINDDEHHAIWQVLSSMVWTDASFKLLTHFALGDESNALSNTLLGQALIDGHVATQVLSIRRLVDQRSDVISIRRLLKDLKRNFGLFTRENFVCFDGLPYDYEAVQHKEMMERVGTGPFWGQTSGPGAHGTSRLAHEQFNRLIGVRPEDRQRSDKLPVSLLTTIERWLDECGADELAKWSHVYLAHAGAPEARTRISELLVTANKITDAIKAMARVTEAISAWLLFAGGRSNTLMPVAQFNPLDKLDRPIMKAGDETNAQRVWEQLSDERNRYLDDVETELIGPAQSKPPHASSSTYVDRLMSAAAANDEQRMEQLCDEEVAATLRDIRGQTKAS